MMQEQSLYLIVLSTADGAVPKRILYTDPTNALPVIRETAHCWYLDRPPHKLPERYRMSEEYQLLNNRFTIYMFGRDSGKLTEAWNQATSA